MKKNEQAGKKTVDAESPMLREAATRRLPADETGRRDDWRLQQKLTAKISIK